jgi:hypothetical protein
MNTHLRTFQKMDRLCSQYDILDSNNGEIYVSSISVLAGVSFMSYANLQRLLSSCTFSYL